MERRSISGQDHQFGGDWTGQKLDVVSKYLRAYSIALSRQPFRKAYIDAFAGTGYRSARQGGDSLDDGEELLFPDLADDAPQALLAGSAKMALMVEPRFDKYIFIERRSDRCELLEGLKTEFPHLATDVDIRQGDANACITDICRRNWRNCRAVLFLDPYGLQVEWATIEAVARTRSIDVWLLFPLAMGVNRLLARSGNIPEAWHRRLSLLLGTDDWYEEFYRVVREPTLFDGDEEIRVEKASMQAIGSFFLRRLAGVFAGVAKEPGVLRNSRNAPLYLLCFAVGNEAAKGPALRIADTLLKGLR